MNSKMNNSFLEIDTSILKENVRAISSHLGGAKLIPVLKDNAYGLGLTEIARRLCAMDGIDMLAVSHVSEAEILRQAGIDADILVISSALPFQLEYAVDNGITLTCARAGMCRELYEVSEKLGKKAHIHLKLDTGLKRIGFRPGEELDGFIKAYSAVSDKVSLDGAFSHFQDASVYSRSREQYELFMKGIEQLHAVGIDIPMRHISSSASFDLYPEFNMDAVRIGRGLYMDHPERPVGLVRELASWRSYICTVSRCPAGTALGYCGNVVLDKNSRIAVVGVGYGDGLDPALADEHASVLIGGRLCPLLVCFMDQCLVDVTGVDCAVGDEVTFYGYDGKGGYISSQAQALLIGDHEGCGLTSELSDRVSRIYK